MARGLTLPVPTLMSKGDFITYPRGLGWARFSKEQPDLPSGDVEVCFPDGRRFDGTWSVVGVEDPVDSEGLVLELRIRGYAAARMSRDQHRALCTSVGTKIGFDRGEPLP